MPVYYFKTENSRSTKEGYVVASSVQKAEEQIERKAYVTKKDIIKLERCSDSVETDIGLTRAVAYKTEKPQHEKYYKELKTEGFTVFSNFVKESLEDRILRDI